MSAARGATQRRTARPLERACSTAPEQPEPGPVACPSRAPWGRCATCRFLEAR